MTMKKVPSFLFLLKDAPNPATARAFVQALVDTGKFARNEKSTICFKVGEPDDYIYLVRKQDLTAVLEDELAVKITGDVGDACWDCLWFMLTSRKHHLPRIGGAWNPEAPLPVRHVAPADRYVRGRDTAR